MAKMMKVLRVELKETTTETIVRHKRHDYVRGGYRIEETIRREISAIPHALLECGHWRQETGTGTSVSKAARLSCWQCECDEREASNAVLSGKPPRTEF